MTLFTRHGVNTIIQDNGYMPRCICNMYTCSGNGTQEQAVQDPLCLVDLYLVYLI